MTGVEPICWGLRKHTQLLMPTLDTTPPKIYSPFTVQIQTPYIEQPLSQMCINIQKWASELSLQHPGSFLCCIFSLSLCTDEWSKKEYPLKVNSRSLTCTVEYSRISLDTLSSIWAWVISSCIFDCAQLYLWKCIFDCECAQLPLFCFWASPACMTVDARSPSLTICCAALCARRTQGGCCYVS